MSVVKAPLSIRLKNSLRGVVAVMAQPFYILLAIVSSFFISGFIIWALNFDLMRFIIFEAPISTLSKLQFFWDVQTGIYSAYSSAQATGILVFSVLFGINIALITYMLKNVGFKNIPKKSGGAGLTIAILSGGCIACGTSILAPLFITIGTITSITALEISNWLNWISSLLIIYSIYKLGGVINIVSRK